MEARIEERSRRAFDFHMCEYTRLAEEMRDHGKEASGKENGAVILLSTLYGWIIWQWIAAASPNFVFLAVWIPVAVTLILNFRLRRYASSCRGIASYLEQIEAVYALGVDPTSRLSLIGWQTKCLQFQRQRSWFRKMFRVGQWSRVWLVAFAVALGVAVWVDFRDPLLHALGKG